MLRRAKGPWQLRKYDHSFGPSVHVNGWVDKCVPGEPKGGRTQKLQTQSLTCKLLILVVIRTIITTQRILIIVVVILMKGVTILILILLATESADLWALGSRALQDKQLKIYREAVGLYAFKPKASGRKFAKLQPKFGVATHAWLQRIQGVQACSPADEWNTSSKLGKCPLQATGVTLLTSSKIARRTSLGIGL